MPQISSLIALLGLFGVAQFDRFTLDPATGAATVQWRLAAAPTPPAPQATLVNLLVGLFSLGATGTTVTGIAVDSRGVPFITLRVPGATA